MVAATGATGLRAWLRAHLPYWMTPKRLRVVTVTLFTVALLGSSVTLNGSTRASQSRAPAHPAHAGALR